jgi:hypothetical protein
VTLGRASSRHAGEWRRDIRELGGPLFRLRGENASRHQPGELATRGLQGEAAPEEIIG